MAAKNRRTTKLQIMVTKAEMENLCKRAEQQGTTVGELVYQIVRNIKPSMVPKELESLVMDVRRQGVRQPPLRAAEAWITPVRKVSREELLEMYPHPKLERKAKR